MAGPHRAVADARNALAALDLPPGTAILLAVSGGADSMALAASAVFAARSKGWVLHSLTVDHALREGSDAEAELVRERLAALGIDARTARIDLDNSTLGPEGEAREGRYAALARAAHSLGAVVLLGHTADDQAETVLLGLARGSGARSIAGMRAEGPLPGHPDIQAFRPLLHLRRADTETICAELALPVVVDPTNAPDGPWRAADGTPLRRSAVRHSALPALESAVGPGVVVALARTAEMIRDDDDALSELAASLADECRVEPGTLDCRKLAPHPAALRRRVIAAEAISSGVRQGDLVYWHVARLDSLVTSPDNNVGIDLPGVRAHKTSGKLRFTAQRS